MATGSGAARAGRLLLAALLAVLVPLAALPAVDEDGWLLGFSSVDDGSGPVRAIAGEVVELGAGAPAPTRVVLVLPPAADDPETPAPTRLSPTDRAPPRA